MPVPLPPSKPEYYGRFNAQSSTWSYPSASLLADVESALQVQDDSAPEPPPPVSEPLPQYPFDELQSYACKDIASCFFIEIHCSRLFRAWASVTVTNRIHDEKKYMYVQKTSVEEPKKNGWLEYDYYRRWKKKYGRNFYYDPYFYQKTRQPITTPKDHRLISIWG